MLAATSILTCIIHHPPLKSGMTTPVPQYIGNKNPVIMEQEGWMTVMRMAGATTAGIHSNVTGF